MNFEDPTHVAALTTTVICALAVVLFWGVAAIGATIAYFSKSGSNQEEAMAVTATITAIVGGVCTIPTLINLVKVIPILVTGELAP